MSEDTKEIYLLVTYHRLFYLFPKKNITKISMIQLLRIHPGKALLFDEKVHDIIYSFNDLQITDAKLSGQ